MLHYVRGDGGMIVIPKEELVRWLSAHSWDNTRNRGWNMMSQEDFVSSLLAELEAIGT